MNEIQSKDLAKLVKNFYYHRALLCERLINTSVEDHYNPVANYYLDAYVISCAAIDGLASIWESMSQIQNQNRFAEFLIYIDKINNSLNKSEKSLERMQRVCTPFLFFELNRQEYEEEFANEIQDRWLQCHSVLSDPTVKEIEEIYQSCYENHPKIESKRLNNVEQELKRFRYASLIYKFHRCSFIHEFRSSEYTVFFNKEEEISVRKFKGYHQSFPQLDVGIGVLIRTIKQGADLVFDLIVDSGYTNIPYSPDDLKFQKPKKASKKKK